MQYSDYDGRLSYVAGRPLDIGANHFDPGDAVPADSIREIPYVESFVSSGYLYVTHGPKGYEALPPHIYGLVKTRIEAEAAVVGESPIVLSAQVEGHEAHINSNDTIRAEAESIVNADFRNPEANQQAARVLFKRGISDVNPDKVEEEPVEEAPEEPKVDEVVSEEATVVVETTEAPPAETTPKPRTRTTNSKK